MGLELVVSNRTVLKTGGAEDWHGRATVKRRPSDNALVQMFRTGTGHNTNDAQLHIRFSNNNGTSWTADDITLGGGAVSGFPMNPPVGNVSYGEGWLYVAPNNDLILHMWSVTGVAPTGTLNGTYQSRSIDGGDSWSAPTQVSFGIPAISDNIVFATDDDFVIGTVIYAAARVYTGGTDGVPTKSVLIKSEDNAATWSYVSTIMDDNEGDAGVEGAQEVGIEYIGNDTIIAMLRDNPHTKAYKRLSADLGLTWGTLDDVTDVFGIAGRQRIYTLAHLRGESDWWTDPNLIMVGFAHNIPGQSRNRGNRIWLSEDAGVTWQGFQLDTDADDCGYGDLFYRGSPGEYGAVNYWGTQTAADLVQYDLTISQVDPPKVGYSGEGAGMALGQALGADR